MDIFSIGSAEQRTQLLKSAANARQGFSGTSDRAHSDSSDFSALAKEMIRAAAEKKKEALSECSAFDQKTGNSSSPSSDEIKAAIKEIANAAAKTAAPSETGKTTAESAAPVWKDGEKTVQQSISEMVKEQMEKIDSLFAETEYDKNNDKMLIDIRQKMRQGKTLSPSEQQYLASKDPDTYSSFQKIDCARKMFRCTLNSCRTRDDVISMRLSNALTALSEYKKAVRNGGSGDAVVGLNAAFENELRDFSRTYRKLPTVAECNKFDKEIAKARKFEREKRLEKRRLAAAKKYKKKKKAVKTPGDGKRTVAQVLADPTSKKVLASRAKRTYCTCPISYDIMSRRMNSKA